jgi:hypothetical protein
MFKPTESLTNLRDLGGVVYFFVNRDTGDILKIGKADATAKYQEGFYGRLNTYITKEKDSQDLSKKMDATGLSSFDIWLQPEPRVMVEKFCKHRNVNVLYPLPVSYEVEQDLTRYFIQEGHSLIFCEQRAQTN